MGEIKQTNFRINNETANAFRAFCEEQGFNQAQGFDHLMDVLAINKAKEETMGRATEIEDFERHVKALINAYVCSIALANDTEDRVKEEFKSRLESKDEQIIKLQGELKEMEEAATKANSVMMEETDKRRQADQSLKDVLEKMENIRNTLKDKENINSMLTAKLAETEKKLADYPELKEANDSLGKKFEKLQQEINEMQRDQELKMERAALEKEKAVAAAELDAEKSLLLLEKQKNEENQKLRDKIEELKDELAEMKLQFVTMQQDNSRN